MIPFSARLRALRGDQKQCDFAKRLGLAQNSYSRYEAGERVPDIVVLSQMVLKLGVSADWLLGLPIPEKLLKDALPAKEAPLAAAKAAGGGTDFGVARCAECERKDAVIADQARSISDLSHSLTEILGRKKAGSTL